MKVEEPILDLSPLLSPESVAVVGASVSIGRGGYAGRLVNNLLDGGFDSVRIYQVNPKYNRIGEMPCYPGLNALPGPVDLAIIVLSRKRVLSTLNQCIENGVKAALILSAGFAEAGAEGKEEQKKIGSIARESGLLICGPNSLGIALPGHRAMIHGYFPLKIEPGGLSLVSQSGAMAFAAILAPALDRNVKFRHVVSTGNEAALESIDFIRHFLRSKEVKAVCCFIEGFKRARRFMLAAEEALEIGKPIIVVKVGRSELGAKQAISHTGAMTGSDRVYQAVFDQMGVVRVPYPDDLVEVADLFVNLPQPTSKGVLIVSTSGGMCSLLADMCGVHGLQLPELAENEAIHIKERDYLLVYGEPTNPLDIRGQGSVHLPEILQPFIDDDRYGVIVASLGVGAVGEISKQIAGPLVKWAERVEKPVVVLWMGNRINDSGSFAEDDGFRILEKSNIPIFYSPEKLIRALSSFFRYHHFRKIWLKRRNKSPQQPLINIDAAGAATFIADRSGVLDEIESRRLLSYYGIPGPREILVENGEAALAAADEVGYPVVLKLVSPDIAHKTEAGMVRLNIGNPDALSVALMEMINAVEKDIPGMKISGYLVQEMVAEARELMVGIKRDEQFGPVVACGLGGVWVEVLADINLRLPPLTRTEAKDMVMALKGARVLSSFRGKPAADLEALSDALVRIGQMAVDLEDRLEELDINPLLVKVKGGGVCAVDALVKLVS